MMGKKRTTASIMNPTLTITESLRNWCPSCDANPNEPCYSQFLGRAMVNQTHSERRVNWRLEVKR